MFNLQCQIFSPLIIHGALLTIYLIPKPNSLRVHMPRTLFKDFLISNVPSSRASLTGWTKSSTLDAARIDVACLTIQTCARTYIYASKGQPYYSNNLENTSIMLLILFEPWAALGKLFAKAC